MVLTQAHQLQSLSPTPTVEEVSIGARLLLAPDPSDELARHFNTRLMWSVHQEPSALQSEVHERDRDERLAQVYDTFDI